MKNEDYLGCEEVKAALFSIPGAKAPGPDGFGSHLYKDSWHIVGNEVVAAVLDMLQHGRILKELNHTVITLIPKTKCPKDVSEFRPISCCGFVHGRFIAHNIMVVQDLVRQYGRKGVKPSCLMKIDLQKSYDTVDWHFLQEMLEYLEFPTVCGSCYAVCFYPNVFSDVQWLYACFHPRCKEIKLTHLCFADDLILCCKGDYPFILLLLQAFKLFSNSSGLKANQRKSSIYCNGVPERDVQRVVDVSGFTRSLLPFKYLRVPICSKNISVAQCSHLVDKIIAKIKM
ncbi:uncharacterized protein [Spinacia oleracea]|uniref:Reverse transcriptase domain-containing protein n=1 Tax=Spinacia oleracea TaxID=3562 RepID=A0ABM3R896_SPIOL|nr:uncharacterized protein LOC130467356 [Spinacia oleracea]